MPSSSGDLPDPDRQGPLLTDQFTGWRVSFLPMIRDLPAANELAVMTHSAELHIR